VRRCAAIGVDDDLAAGEARVAVGAADEELAGRVDVPDGVLGHPALGKRFEHEGLDDRAHVQRRQTLVDVLMGDDDLGYANGFAVGVADRDLAL